MNKNVKRCYSVRANHDFSRINFSGTLRLPFRDEYERILRMLRHVALRDGFEIDLRHLKFLDSMGIATFGRFLTEMHQIGKKVTIIGNKANAWQDKSLSSFARLYNNLTVNLK